MFLLRPIFTRAFFFLYLLGIVSSIVTIPPYKTAVMYPDAPWELLLDVYLVAAVLCVLPHRIRLVTKATLYAVLYPLYVVDTFCFVKFGTTINPTMLLLVGETNSSEASGFLASYLTPDLLLSPVGVILLVPLAHLAAVLLTPRIRRMCPTVRRNKPLLIAADILLVVLLAIAAPDAFDNKRMYAHTMSCQTIGQVEHSLAYRPHTEMYQPPMRLAFALRANHLIAQQLTRLIGTERKAQVDSCDFKTPDIVWIIGESHNVRHSQLYGYDKKNQPRQTRLMRQQRLTRFDDVVSPWNLTSFVFKHFMTTYVVGDSDDWCDHPLFCEIFRKAGYRVTFLTNQFLPQAKEAVYDFSGGFFINNPELSAAQFDERNESLHVFDEGLLHDYDILQERLAHEPRHTPSLTIFHLIGMHVNYRIRCPNSKKRWGADTYPDDMDMPESRRRTMADYDNAVWYNDSVIGQIIDRFSRRPAVIIYTADHGEEVFGPGARHFFGRMHNTDITARLADEEFRIPMWIYTTRAYDRQHPEVRRAIRAAARKPYMTDAIAHLLLGLAGIHTPHYRPDCDILAPQYNAERPRVLKGTTQYPVKH